MLITVENVLLSNSVPWSLGVGRYWAKMKILVTHGLPEKKSSHGSHYGIHFLPLACIASRLDRCQGTVLLSSRQEMGFKCLASSDVCPHGIRLPHRSLWLGSRWQGEAWGTNWCRESVETFHCSWSCDVGQHLGLLLTWYEHASVHATIICSEQTQPTRNH